MLASDELKKEHDAVEELLKVLEAICKRIDAKEKINPEHFDEIIEFCHGFIDECHHTKEEHLLFPEIMASGLSKEEVLMGEILAEHVIGRSYVNDMGAAITEYKAGDSAASSKFHKSAKDYISLLREHVKKENGILYPLSDRTIPAKRQKELLRDFKTVERERIGDKTHEKLAAILEKLKKTYR